MLRHSSVGVTGAVLLLAGLPAVRVPAADGNVLSSNELPELVVVGTTPMSSSALPAEQVPGNVQTLSGNQLQGGHALSVAEALNAGLGSVNVNDTQGNPFQLDVNFRGFTASPVLGTPQGLSVLIDGARANEVFGDTVNWDLIPESALANVLLIPGSNPVYGLSSTGGTLAINTKSGFQFPGTSIEASDGAFDRRNLIAQTGGHGEVLDYFSTINLFQDAGWGEHNGSKLLQWFSKLGYTDAATDVDLSYTHADAELAGNQTLPLSWLNTPRESYTWPDTERNSINFLNLQLRREFAGGWALSGDLHERQVHTAAFNSNVNGDFNPSAAIDPVNEPTDNVIDSSYQARTGGSAELSWVTLIAGRRNTFAAGLNGELGTADFAQNNQPAGSQRDTVSELPASPQVLLRTRATDLGVYAIDTLAVGTGMFLTVSGRYDDAVTQLQDQLGTALDGRHANVRFNPALGATYNPNRTMTVWASYGAGMRIPTPVELTCANAQAPCSLPNAFSSDPALKPVLSRTIELGARSTVPKTFSWSASLFRTTLADDIEFISSGGGATSSGYFSNVGNTLREGLELHVARTLGALRVDLHYSYVRASFESSAIFSSPNNSSAAPISCPTCTDIQIVPGDRIPGIPANNARLRSEYALGGHVAVALDVLAQSYVYARGDENNRDVNGPVPGFVVLNADAHVDLSPTWRIFVKASNLLNRSYSTFGALGQNDFTGPNRSFDLTGTTWRNEQFRSVGPPFGLWVGIQYRPHDLPDAQ